MFKIYAAAGLDAWRRIGPVRGAEIVAGRLRYTSRTMHRTLRHVLIAVALLFTQQAAQLHALSHLGRDLAVAERGDKKAPPVGHPAEQCLAFHAVGSALPTGAPGFVLPRIEATAVAHYVQFLPFSPRLAFDSRAPPVLS